MSEQSRNGISKFPIAKILTKQFVGTPSVPPSLQLPTLAKRLVEPPFASAPSANQSNLLGRPLTVGHSTCKSKIGIVVVHFWETKTPYSTSEFETFQRIAEKYKNDVIVVGANIDEKTEDFKAFMRKNKSVRWTQLHSPGGVFKSPLAHQLGPASLPLVVLFDANGEMVEQSVPADYLDREIQRLIRKNK